MTKDKKDKKDQSIILFLLAGVGAILIGTRSKQQTTPGNNLPRGLRNNNIGNIKKNSSNSWLGKIVPGQDETFEQFQEKKYGSRALLILLKNYLSNYNISSIRDVLSRYAPGSENPTSTYISFVSNRMALDPDVTLNKSDIIKLAEAIAYFENGMPATTIEELKSVSNEFNLGV